MFRCLVMCAPVVSYYDEDQQKHICLQFPIKCVNSFSASWFFCSYLNKNKIKNHVHTQFFLNNMFVFSRFLLFFLCDFSLIKTIISRAQNSIQCVLHQCVQAHQRDTRANLVIAFRVFFIGNSALWCHAHENFVFSLFGCLQWFIFFSVHGLPYTFF